MGSTHTTLTALERELLRYVEQLTAACEDSATQFAELEKRSTGAINARLLELESCVILLLKSQISLVSGLSASAPGSAPLPPGWLEAGETLAAALRQLETPPV